MTIKIPCTCPCHDGGGVMHMLDCCFPGNVHEIKVPDNIARIEGDTVEFRFPLGMDNEVRQFLYQFSDAIGPYLTKLNQTP